MIHSMAERCVEVTSLDRMESFCSKRPQHFVYSRELSELKLIFLSKGFAGVRILLLFHENPFVCFWIFFEFPLAFQHKLYSRRPKGVPEVQSDLMSR